jgi:hypothetical protein
VVVSLTADQLYALLPATYRVRDAEQGQALQALIQVMAGQAAILQANIRQLYDDQLIETCASWVIPYLGDLVGANPAHEIGAAARGRRAEVANTIGYRRRKGTPLALEQLAMDVSGRPAVAVESFKRLITSESMHHVRPRHEGTANLRSGDRLDHLGSAFDTLNRTVDVRRIAPRVRAPSDPDATAVDIDLHGGGAFNVPDIRIHLWRWKSQPVTNAPAFAVDPRRYMFSPLGQDMALFNTPLPRESFARLSDRLDVPQPIRRREFHRTPADFYGTGTKILLIADGVPVDVAQICCRDLSDEAGVQWGCTAPDKIAIDPWLGRIQLGANVHVPRQLRVTYGYGFPADLGGGPYSRAASLPSLNPAGFQFFAVVGAGASPTLEQAVAAWNLEPPGATGLIVLPDFESFAINLTKTAAVIVPSGSRLWIVAARPEPGGIPGPSESCVTLRGEIEVRGKTVSAGDSGNPPPAGSLFVSGVWLSGSVEIGGDAVDVQFADCTLVPGIALARDGLPILPGEPSIVVSAPGIALRLLRTISGPVGAAVGSTSRICSSIVDSGSRCSVAYAGADLASEGADLHIEDSTVIGKVRVHTMELASNTIFLARRARHDPWAGAVWCSRKQSGCMRFCFVPSDSITPRRFRCLPDDPSHEAMLDPKFVTLRYGHPSYGLLSSDGPMAIWTGADNGSQMGVYRALEETEAVRSVQLRIPEFLPFNLEAGIFLEPSAAVVIPRPPFVYGYGQRGPSDPCGDPGGDELLFVGVGAHLI